jgi:ubiquinone/menaquinone biosynthesis C-methylase UbiE
MKPNLSANLDVFDAPDVVQSYTGVSELQPGEVIILNEFRASLPAMRFLDIGVGAGRTTVHFAPKVKEYVGVDYAKEMVRACERRFESTGGRVRFAVCDARDMSQFADASFDFVLFSYNGIDYLPHEDRMIILREIRRVLKPDGWYFFSSHNLRFLPRLFRFPLFFSISKMRRKLTKFRLLRQHNPNFQELTRRPHAFLYDGVHEFRVQTYYVDPREQVEQLKQVGFRGTRLFSENGKEVTLASRRLNKDTWVFYLCQR